MNIFVGNLSFDSTEKDVRRLFEGFGIVASAVIVMDKKGKKSRGFGFVQMPDVEQAQAAITALNGKEFMGRPLNVEPARPKPEAGRDSRKKEKMQPKFKAETQHTIDGESGNQAKPRFNPVFKRTGGYRGGRRTLSFLRKRAEASIEEQVMPQRKNKENPMRWRKKREQSRPWQKKREESKPWQKRQGESKPWEKTGVESKPWRKAEGEFRQKSQGESKPWQKSSNRKKQFQFKGRKKSGEHKR